MNDYLNFPTEEETSRTAMPQGSGEEPRTTRSGAAKGRFAAILCACLVAAGGVGLGGGYIGASIATSQAASSGVQTTIPPATNTLQTAPTQSSGEVMTVSQVVSSVSDSVVEINTEVQATNFMMQQVTGEAAGSGVILSQDGYIITNNHVVEDAQSITVRLKDGTSYDAKLVGADAQTDIAVIKIEASGLTAAKTGSSSALQVGDDAIAIGNPLGELGGTVTNGIISAVDRDVTIDGETRSLIQTNAAINPGNSGGGLFNNKGELIGIVVAKSSGSDIEGLGFAVPIDTASSVASDLIAHGYVTGRGKMGVSTIDISDSRTAFMYRVPQTGVYVAEVQIDSAAQKAGLKVGDAVLAVDGEEISTSAELKSKMEQHSAGDAVELTVLRDSQKLTLSVTLDESVPESVQTKEA